MKFDYVQLCKTSCGTLLPQPATLEIFDVKLRTVVDSVLVGFGVGLLNSKAPSERTSLSIVAAPHGADVAGRSYCECQYDIL